jgi:hypothetical protein
MPVIVYKTLTLNIRYAQIRRIVCSHCHQTFSYVWDDRQDFEAKGIPVVSSDEGMRRSAMKKAVAALSKIAQNPDKGMALCPHCKCFQPWMVRSGLMTLLGCGGDGALVLASAIAFAAGVWGGAGNGVILAIIIGGTVLGLVLASRLAPRKGPHPQREDPAAKADPEIGSFLEKCQQEGVDPVLAWHLAAGSKVSEVEAFVSLGVLDKTGQRPVFPRELNTSTVLRQLEQ